MMHNIIRFLYLPQRHIVLVGMCIKGVNVAGCKRPIVDHEVRIVKKGHTDLSVRVHITRRQLVASK